MAGPYSLRSLTIPEETANYFSAFSLVYLIYLIHIVISWLSEN
jgi:hypothetical protein